MLKENELLRSLMSQPLSVYFDAYRTEVNFLSIDVLSMYITCITILRYYHIAEEISIFRITMLEVKNT